MKYILMLYMMSGAAPTDHHMLTTAEFDDKPACQGAVLAFQRIYNRNTTVGVCVPKKTPPAGKM